jgi:pimeloyl-ACP methyl ester carboxylesterase
MTYGRMAVDVVRVLDTLDLDRAHVVGHSDGGCILLHLLVDHPDRVASATLIGTPLHLDDYRPGSSDALGALLDTMRPAAIDQFGLGAHYESLSPHPERKAELADRLGATWRTQPVWSDAVLALVPSPVLVVGVDGDEFLDREVFIRTAEVFPQGEIVWVDEGAHAVPMTHPAAVAEAIASFVARHG